MSLSIRERTEPPYPKSFSKTWGKSSTTDKIATLVLSYACTAVCAIAFRATIKPQGEPSGLNVIVCFLSMNAVIPAFFATIHAASDIAVATFNGAVNGTVYIASPGFNFIKRLCLDSVARAPDRTSSSLSSSSKEDVDSIESEESSESPTEFFSCHSASSEESAD